jgi:hypothetical protein
MLSINAFLLLHHHHYKRFKQRHLFTVEQNLNLIIGIFKSEMNKTDKASLNELEKMFKSGEINETQTEYYQILLTKELHLSNKLAFSESETLNDTERVQLSIMKTWISEKRVLTSFQRKYLSHLVEKEDYEQRLIRRRLKS